MLELPRVSRIVNLSFVTMKKIFPLALALLTFAAYGFAQSGRKVVRPATHPVPPVQAPVFHPPDPEPEAKRVELAPLRSLPDTLRKRELRSLDNSSFRLTDFQDRVVVLNLWATWCPPCKREVPEYEKVRQEYVDRNIEFIALTTEDPRTAKNVKEFVRKFNFGFRVGWADRQTALTLMNGYEGIPQTLVIAPGGRVVSHWHGFSKGNSGDTLRAALERALVEVLGGR